MSRRGDGDADAGGTSGTGATTAASGGTFGTSISGGTAGTAAGGQGGTGARGGTGGRGGTTSGFGGDLGGGGTGGDAGGGGDAGAAGAPICDGLAGGRTCSFERTCASLGCGEPWSIYGEGMCHRTSCAESGLCEAGERCVAAPVAGRFDDPCRNEADSCDETANGCECVYYEECSPAVFCLPTEEFPPEKDCPIANLGCADLERAMATLDAYLDGESDVFYINGPYEAPANVAASLDACFDAVFSRYENECD